MINMEDMAKEHQRLTKTNNNSFLDKFVKMPEKTGWVIVRLLSPVNGPLPYCCTRTHKINGKNVHCLRNIVPGRGWQGKPGSDCPICEYYSYLYKESDKIHVMEDKQRLTEEAKALKPLERFYWNAIVLESSPNLGQGISDGPLILSIGSQIQTKIMNAWFGDPKMKIDPLGDITDRVTGRNLQIIKKSTQGAFGVYPSYTESQVLGVSQICSEQKFNDWLANMHDIMGLRKLLSIEEVKREIRIHRGVEKDPRNSFDLSEYSASSVAEKIVSTPVGAIKVEVPSKPQINLDGLDLDSDEGVNDEFVQELRRLASNGV